MAGALRSQGELTKAQTGRVQSLREEIDVDYDFPVAINTMGSKRRMSLALGVEDFEEHAERIERLIKPELPNGPIETLKKLPNYLERSRTRHGRAPPPVAGRAAEGLPCRSPLKIGVTVPTTWPFSLY